MLLLLLELRGGSDGRSWEGRAGHGDEDVDLRGGGKQELDVVREKSEARKDEKKVSSPRLLFLMNSSSDWIEGKILVWGGSWRGRECVRRAFESLRGRFAAKEEERVVGYSRRVQAGNKAALAGTIVTSAHEILPAVSFCSANPPLLGGGPAKAVSKAVARKRDEFRKGRELTPQASEEVIRW